MRYSLFAMKMTSWLDYITAIFAFFLHCSRFVFFFFFELSLLSRIFFFFLSFAGRFVFRFIFFSGSLFQIPAYPDQGFFDDMSELEVKEWEFKHVVGHISQAPGWNSM